MAGKGYLMNEKKAIIRYLLNRNGFHEVKGRRIWVELEESRILKRSWQSLKEVFIKRILPDIHNPYYGLSKEDIVRFKKGYGSSHERTEWMKKKSPTNDDKDDSDDLSLIISESPYFKNGNENVNDKKEKDDQSSTPKKLKLSFPHPDISSINNTQTDKSDETILDSPEIMGKRNTVKEKQSIFLSSDDSPSLESNYDDSNNKKNINGTHNNHNGSSNKDHKKQATSVMKRPYEDRMFGFSSGKTYVHSSKGNYSKENKDNNSKCPPYKYSSSDNTESKKHRQAFKRSASSDSISSGDSVKFIEDNLNSDSDPHLRDNEIDLKRRPMFASYRDKLYRLEVGNSKTSSGCYMTYQKPKIYAARNIKKYKLKDRRPVDFEEKKQEKEGFCCNSLERLYYNNFLRYINEGKIGTKPRKTDYQNKSMLCSSVVQHCQGCKYDQTEKVIPLKYSYKEYVNPKLTQSSMNFPNEEIELQYYRDLERYFKNGQIGTKPIKESYQRVLTEDEKLKHKKYSHLYTKNKLDVIYIDDDDLDDEIQSRPSIKNKKIVPYKLSDDVSKAAEYWKTKYIEEKSRNDMIFKMIAATGSKNSILGTMVTSDFNSINYINGDQMINDKMSDQQDNHTCIQAKSNDIIPEVYKNVNGKESPLLSTASKISGCKISFMKHGQQDTKNNIYVLDSQKADMVIEFVEKINITQNPVEKKNINNDQQPSCSKKIEPHIFNDTSSKKDKVVTAACSSINETEKKIFDIIQADKVDSNDCQMDREIFSPLEIKMMLNDGVELQVPTKIISEEKKKDNTAISKSKSKRKSSATTTSTNNDNSSTLKDSANKDKSTNSQLKISDVDATKHAQSPPKVINTDVKQSSDTKESDKSEEPQLKNSNIDMKESVQSSPRVIDTKVKQDLDTKGIDSVNAESSNKNAEVIENEKDSSNIQSNKEIHENLPKTLTSSIHESSSITLKSSLKTPNTGDISLNQINLNEESPKKRIRFSLNDSFRESEANDNKSINKENKRKSNDTESKKPKELINLEINFVVDAYKVDEGKRRSSKGSPTNKTDSEESIKKDIIDVEAKEDGSFHGKSLRSTNKPKIQKENSDVKQNELQPILSEDEKLFLDSKFKLNPNFSLVTQRTSKSNKNTKDRESDHKYKRIKSLRNKNEKNNHSTPNHRSNNENVKENMFDFLDFDENDNKEDKKHSFFKPQTHNFCNQTNNSSLMTRNNDFSNQIIKKMNNITSLAISAQSASSIILNENKTEDNNLHFTYDTSFKNEIFSCNEKSHDEKIEETLLIIENALRHSPNTIDSHLEAYNLKIDSGIKPKRSSIFDDTLTINSDDIKMISPGAKTEHKANPHLADTLILSPTQFFTPDDNTEIVSNINNNEVMSLEEYFTPPNFDERSVRFSPRTKEANDDAHTYKDIDNTDLEPPNDWYLFTDSSFESLIEKNLNKTDLSISGFSSTTKSKKRKSIFEIH